MPTTYSGGKYRLTQTIAHLTLNDSVLYGYNVKYVLKCDVHGSEHHSTIHI